MNRIETLLCVLAEECAEVAQRCSKAMRFGADQSQGGQDDTNVQRIDDELQDLYGVVEMLREQFVAFGVPDRRRIDAKKLKVESYMRATPSQIERLDREHTGD